MNRAPWIVVALLGCSATPPPPPRTAPPPPPPPSPAIVHARGDWFGTEHPVAGLGGRGATRFLLGPIRAQVGAEGVSLADDQPVDSIDEVVEADGGRWVFVTLRGAVLASDGFLGALRPLGYVPAGARTNASSRGRATSVRAGRLWITDGATLAEAQVPGAPVADASFASAASGAVVHRDGALSVTDDGGRTWRAVDLRGELALSVWFDGTSLRVATTRGPQQLASGALTAAPPAPANAVDVDDERRVADAVARVRLAVQRRSGFHGTASLTLPSGAAVALTDGILTWLPPGGEPALGRVGSRDCGTLLPWGDGFAVVCGRLLRGDASGRLVHVELPPESRDDGAMVLSDDGRHAAREGACPTPPDPSVSDEERYRASMDESAEAPPPAMCVLEDGRGRWRSVPLPATEDRWRPWSLVGMHGTMVLLRTNSDAPDWRILDTASGQSRSIPVDPAVAPVSLAWLRDGSLVGVGRGEDGRFVLVRGGPEAPLRVTPLPEGAVRVAFADASRGLAHGERLGAVWRTLDGGATWDNVPVPDALHGVEVRAFEGAACDDGGCALGRHLRITGWGPMRPEAGNTVAVPGEPPEVADPRPREADVRLPAMRCTAAPAARPSPWRLPPSEATDLRAEGLWSFDRLADGRTRVRWAGAGGRGEAIVPAARSDRGELVGLWGGPGRALLAHEADGVLYLATGAIARPLEGATFPADWASLRPRLQSTDVVADGASLRLQSRGVVENEGVDASLTVDPTGAVARRYDVRLSSRDLYGVTASFRALARRGGRWSRALVSADGVRVEGPDGEALLQGWEGELAPCAAPPAPDAVTLRVVGCSGTTHCASGTMFERTYHEVAEVELARTGACVRSLRAVTQGRVGASRDFTDGRSLWSLRADRGAFVGFSDDGERRVAVRCARATGD